MQVLWYGGKKCNKCGRDGYFSKKFASSSVNHLEDCEIYSHKATFKSVLMKNKAEVQLQVDTGASCNVLPRRDYTRVTGDNQCNNLEKSYSRLVMHNTSVVRPLGQIRLVTERKGRKYGVLYHIVKEDLAPPLCRTTREKTNLVKILDADINATHDERTHVPSVVKENPVLSEFSDVFSGVGCLDGNYSIRVDESFSPVVHLSSKVPVPLR